MNSQRKGTTRMSLEITQKPALQQLQCKNGDGCISCYANNPDGFTCTPFIRNVFIISEENFDKLKLQGFKI